MKLFGRREPEPSHDYDLDEVVQTAQTGRKLAIYDRGTGLYAYWYLQLRGDEEISRARRYQKPLSLLSIWAPTQDLVSALAEHLRDRRRDTDLAGYLNGGHFVLILCETSDEGAEIVRTRLRDGISEDLDVSFVTFPDDGETFDDLLERAKARGSAERPAA